MPVVLAVFVALLFLTPPEAAFAQEAGQQVKIVMPTDALVTRVDAKIDQWVYAGNILAVLKDSRGGKILLRAGISGKLVFWRLV